MKPTPASRLKLALLTVVLCMGFGKAKAQYVAIPDTNFAFWLWASGYIDTMGSNLLDTTNPQLLSTHKIIQTGPSFGVLNLSGIEYFKNLDTLKWRNDAVQVIPKLPQNLVWCDVSHNAIQQMSYLPPHLVYFSCDDNQLSSLPATTPPSLLELYCRHNLLNYTPNLNSGLIHADFSFNNISYCTPPLPASLGDIDFSYCRLDSLPPIPPVLYGLYCAHNRLTVLPRLDTTHVIILYCEGNMLTSIPTLPSYFIALSCSYNPITELPAIPASIWALYCDHTLISSIPPLPGTMRDLYCNDNPALTCLPLLGTIENLDFSNTGITCVPNYATVTQSYIPSIANIPLCGIFNTHGCATYWNISGHAFYDTDQNCIYDAADAPVHGAKLMLYSNGNLVQQVYADLMGNYSFQASNGNYQVRADTTGLPLIVSCPVSNVLYDTLSASDSLIYDNNFAYKCRTTGFDVGVNNIATVSAIRPGADFQLHLTAGDLSQLYQATCATGISGQVQLIFSGPVHYLGPAGGGLTPNSVSGNVLIWNIGDFGTVNINSAFGCLFSVDTTATSAIPVCITVTVTSAAGDYNPANNTLVQCFGIFNSYDPNEKEVYPTILDSTNQWLTYTVHFQNTGNAPALNIRVLDTLDSSLDPATFELLAYSHRNITQVFDNVVVFNFPNINLVDSFVSDSASRGYIQFRIKIRNNVSPRTNIGNQAYIYFDYNPPIVTNYASTVFVPADSVSLSENICQGVTYNFFGQQLNSTGNYYHTLQNIYNRDSIIGLTLTVNPADSVLVSQNICHGQVFDFYGQQLGSPGTYYEFFQNVHGCDSVVRLSLSVSTEDSINIAQAICTGEVFDFYGQQVTSAGIYYHSFQNIYGCDSVIRFALSVNPSDSTSSYQSICSGGAFDFYGQQLTNTGTYYHSFQNIHGCDSVIRLSLLVKHNDSTSLSQNMCSGEVYDFYGQQLTGGGVYQHGFQNIFGCDSVVFLFLNVNPVYIEQVDTVITEGSVFHLPWGGVATTTGVYTDSLVSMEGCDSILAVNLNVVSSILSTQGNMSEVNIYPNPVTDALIVDAGSDWIGGNVVIADEAGRTVTKYKLQSTRESLMVEDFVGGLYFITITSGTGKITTQKFVKQ